jgi:hypothetical protein
MRTLSLFSCLILVVAGFNKAIAGNQNGFIVGSILMCIGAIAMLIIAPRTKKIKGYNPNHWMNR